MLQNLINYLQFTQTNVVEITSSQNYTVPANVAAILVVATGGGGGSGGTAGVGFSQGAASGNGGGGGVCMRAYNRADLPSTVAVTIGAGGTAGAAGNNAGGNGGDTTFLGMTAGGGLGSAGGPNITGGAIVNSASGGTATGGQLNIVCPAAQPRGILIIGTLAFSDSQRAIPVTGFGVGALGQSQANNVFEQAGFVGFAGQVTIYEFLI